MSILMTEDRKELIVTCNCHCDNAFHIMIDEEYKDDDLYCYMAYMKGNFYADSNLSFLNVF